jgi:multiple sugar transport system permease protein
MTDMTATPAPTRTPATPVRRPQPRVRWGRVALHSFLISMSIVWLWPLVWALYTSFRTFGDVQHNGYVSLPSSLTIQNYIDAWTQGDLLRNFIQTLAIVIPGVTITLIVASMIAFAVTKFSWRFNVLVLMLFTAGNLLPAQVIIVPLYHLYLFLPLPDFLSDSGSMYNQIFGILFINVVFQTGFCVFVLSNYMKTLSKELVEAAMVDGAGVFRIWWSVILPLCRPALAALATLEFTFIYNDFFWALILIGKGDRRPITSALNNLQGQFFTNYNLLAAGAIMVAIPTVFVYIVLQKHFIRGLSLGATKG